MLFIKMYAVCNNLKITKNVKDKNILMILTPKLPQIFKAQF